MLSIEEIRKRIDDSYELPNRVLDVMPEPMVTVRTSTFQHVSYIKQCIEGVLMQKTTFPFEFIIGEDFSTDGTRETVFEYAQKYPDIIRVFTADYNVGVKANGRRCGQASRGKYMALCDGDDYWTDPLKLQKQVDFLEANPDYVICYHNASIIDEAGKLVSSSKLPDNCKRDFSNHELKTGAWVLALTRCFRNIINDLPDVYYKFSGSCLNGDSFFTSVLGEYGKGKYLSNIQDAVYRKHQNSIWSSLPEIEQNYNSIITYAALHRYYSILKDDKYALYYKKVVIALVQQFIHRWSSLNDNAFIVHFSKLLKNCRDILIFKGELNSIYDIQNDKRSVYIKKQTSAEHIKGVALYEFFQALHLTNTATSVLFWPGVDARLGCDVVDFPRLRLCIKNDGGEVTEKNVQVFQNADVTKKIKSVTTQELQEKNIFWDAVVLTASELVPTDLENLLRTLNLKWLVISDGLDSLEQEQRKKVKETLLAAGFEQGSGELDAYYWKDKSLWGEVLFSENRITEAIKCFEQLLSEDPSHLNALNNLGVISYQFDQLEAAEKFLLKAVRLNRRDFNALINLSRVYFKMERFSDAAELFQEAASLDEDNASVWFHLGLCYEQSNRNSEALEAYKRCNELGDNQWPVCEKIEALEKYVREKLSKENFEIETLDATFRANSDPKTQQALEQLYPRHKQFANNGMRPIAKSSSRNYHTPDCKNPFADKKVLFVHHWPLASHRKPVFSDNTVYLSVHNEKGNMIVNVPQGSRVDMEIILKELKKQNWEPDLFVAKVDAYQQVVPVNIVAIKCPKVLILGDTQHGNDPLITMISYALSEKYDFYVTDHKRHHLWFYHLAGIKNTFWLPGLFLNPPLPGYKETPFANEKISENMVKGGAIFIGQAAKFHPRRKKLIEAAKSKIPYFRWGMMSQADSLKTYNLADISLNISLNGDLNLRFMEIISAGGLQLSDRLADESGAYQLLEENKEVIFFDDVEDMLEKISYFHDNPEENLKIRNQAYERYKNEYEPSKMLSMFDNILSGKQIEERFTSASLSRIKYISDVAFSPERVSIYQLAQDQHRVNEHVDILIDAQFDFSFPEDFIDLPRLNVTTVDQTEGSSDRLEKFIKHSPDAKRLKITSDVTPGKKYDLIISKGVNTFSKDLLKADQSILIYQENDPKGSPEIRAVSKKDNI